MPATSATLSPLLGPSADRSSPSQLLSSCGSQESGPSVGDVLVRVLEQKQHCAQTFCRLLSLSRRSLPLLEPLFQDLERAGESSSCLSPGR